MKSIFCVSRRAVLRGGLSAVTATALPVRAAPPAVHVVKGAGCECCAAWAEYLAAEGFEVTEEERYGAALIQFKLEKGVPQRVYSCHTGLVGRYFLEGHVPAAEIRRLIDEQPDAIGLAVPGMPYGSPGMGSDDKRVSYDVLLIKLDGASEVFASYPEA